MFCLSDNCRDFSGSPRCNLNNVCNSQPHLPQLTYPVSYFEIVFSVLTGFSVNLSANLQAVEIIWE